MSTIPTRVLFRDKIGESIISTIEVKFDGETYYETRIFGGKLDGSGQREWPPPLWADLRHRQWVQMVQGKGFAERSKKERN